MSEEKKYLLLIGLYGRFQIEMIDLDMINSDGSVKTKKRKYYQTKDEDGEEVTRWRPLKEHEIRAIEIYSWIREQMKDISEEALNAKAEYTNEVAHKLINESRMVNNFLLALIMFQLFVDDAPFDLQVKMKPKIDTLINYFQSFDTEEHKAVRKTTHRVADNMYRVFTDRPQLSDEVRDAKYAAIFKR